MNMDSTTTSAQQAPQEGDKQVIEGTVWVYRKGKWQATAEEAKGG